MKIGIIGSGEMGVCLASKFVKLGHQVSIANSRGPASLRQVSVDTGALAVTVEEAISKQDVVIVSIPSKNIPDLPKNIFARLSNDVAVIDTVNYYPTLRDGILPDLEHEGIDSLWVQQQLKVPIVKTFNAILATSLMDFGRPKGDTGRIAIPISGGSEAAKKLIISLIDALGFDAADIGDIFQSWKQQPGSPIYCRDIPSQELQRRASYMGTDWPVERKHILAKRKSDEALMKSDYSSYLQSLV